MHSYMLSENKQPVATLRGDNGAATTDSVRKADSAAPRRRRRTQLNGAVVSTATKLLPLIELLETIQPHIASESVFHAKRVKINAQVGLVYAQLRAEQPKRKALLHAFRTLSNVVREETREISKDEVKDAAREFVLATIKNAPGLISAAHQAGLLS